MPVFGSTKTAIQDIEITSENWYLSHLDILKQSYRETQYFSEIAEIFTISAEKCDGKISKFNQDFIARTCDYLGIDTELVNGRDVRQTGKKADLLISICKEIGADTYLSGPLAQAYIGNEFDNAGIEIEWMDYSNYVEYNQLYGDFEHGVSIIDLISMKGKDSIQLI